MEGADRSNKSDQMHPTVVIHYMYPNVLFAYCTQPAVCRIIWACARLFETNAFVREFSAFYARGRTCYASARTYAENSSCRRFLHLDMIDSIRGASHGYCDCICTCGLWHNWLDQLNSGMLTQRDLTYMSRIYTHHPSNLDIYTSRYDTSLIR